MDLLNRFAPAASGTACLIMAMGCGMRDLSSPIFPTGSDSVAVVVQPIPQKTGKDTTQGPAGKILIETLTAADMRLTVGQTKKAPVTVLPASATSPLYELTSST
jgi:hypothetical protein